MNQGGESGVGLLRAAGLRLTLQRQLVLEALEHASGRHVSAEEVWRTVHERYPSFNLSTAYRVLDLLTSVGVIRPTRLGGSVIRYELGGAEGHHHLLCSRCGRVLDLPADDLAGLRKRAFDRHHFRVGAGEVTIQGECDGCYEATLREPLRPGNEPAKTAGATAPIPRPKRRSPSRPQRVVPFAGTVSGSGGSTKPTSRAAARARSRA